MEDQLEFNAKANVNKFDVGREYNERTAKGDFLGFFKWLLNKIPVSIKEMVSRMIDNLKTGLWKVHIAGFKGNFVTGDKKDTLPDASVNEYQNEQPELYEQQTAGIFKALGMSDMRYRDPEYITRAGALDMYFAKYVEAHDGRIENKDGKAITKKILRDAHRSVELGEGIHTLKFDINGEHMDMCLLEKFQIEQLEASLGVNDMISKASDQVGDFYMFDMNNPDIKKMIINSSLNRKMEQNIVKTEEFEVNPEEKPAEPTKEVVITKDIKEEIPEPEKTVSDTLQVGIKHYDGKDMGGYKRFKMESAERLDPKLYKQYDKLREHNKKVRDTVISSAKDLSQTFVTISAASNMVGKEENIVKIPMANDFPPEGISNPHKAELYIKIPDRELGSSNKRMARIENKKKGSVSRIFTLGMDEKLTVCDKEGNPIKTNNGEMQVEVKNLIENYTVQSYITGPVKENALPKAEVAERVTKPAKEVIFDEKTTKFAKNTISDMTELEIINFNHAKATVGFEAFRNLPGNIRIKNAENITFEENSFINTGKLVFIMPDIVSDNKAAVLEDLHSKAMALNATVEEPEPVTTIESLEEAQYELEQQSWETYQKMIEEGIYGIPADPEEEIKARKPGELPEEYIYEELNTAYEVNGYLILINKQPENADFPLQYEIYDKNFNCVDEGREISEGNIFREYSSPETAIQKIPYEIASSRVQEVNFARATLYQEQEQNITR